MRGREAALTASVGVAALAVQLPIFDRWIGMLDEGYILAIAEDVLRGKVLYRDVYVDNPLPGAFYVVAAWFRLVGSSVWASRVLAVCLFTVFAMLVFRLGRAVLSGRWAVLLALMLLCYRLWAFPHWHMTSYSSVSATLLAGALVAAFQCVGARRPAWLMATGVLVGAAIVCKQDYGLGVGGALGLVWLLRPWLARSSAGAFVPAALYTAGIGLVVVPVLGAFAAAGALGALLDQTLLRPLLLESSFNYARLPPVLPLFGQTPGLRGDTGSYFPAILLTLPEWWNGIYSGWVFRETALWDVTLKLVFYAPFLAVIVGAIAWLRRRPADEHRLILLAYAGGLLLAFNRPRDWVHLMMIYPPTLLIGLVLASSAPARLARAAWAVLGATVIALALVSVRLAGDLRQHFDWPLAAPRAGVVAERLGGPLIDDVLAYVAERSAPGTPLPSLPIAPMLTFLAGREGAAGFYVVWPGQHPARDERIIADLESRGVDVVLYGLSQYVWLGRFRDSAPLLYDYLVDHFTIARVFAREPFGPLMCALERRPVAEERGRSLLDLVPGAEPSGVLTVARWPFAEVIAQTVGTSAAPAVAYLPLDVPPGAARLAFSYGVNPERWLEPASGPFTFSLALETPSEPAVAVFQATVDPQRTLADRQWKRAQVDLGRWAGRRVRLAFAIAADATPPDPASLAGWAEPRLVDH
jgi:hypothetical protein